MINSKGLDAFEARLQRIAKQEGGSKQLLAGEGDVSETRISEGAMRRAQAKRAKGTPQSAGSLILAAPKWAIAFVIGCAMMLLGRLLGFHLLEGMIVSGDPTMDMLLVVGEIGIGFAALVALATFVGPRGAMAKMAMMGGFALMLVGEADVAKQAPGAWEAMFSAEYAATVLQPTAGAMANFQSIAAALQNI